MFKQMQILDLHATPFALMAPLRTEAVEDGHDNQTSYAFGV